MIGGHFENRIQYSCNQFNNLIYGRYPLIEGYLPRKHVRVLITYTVILILYLDKATQIPW